jgi:hypothetical protein
MAAALPDAFPMARILATFPVTQRQHPGATAVLVDELDAGRLPGGLGVSLLLVRHGAVLPRTTFAATIGFGR